MWRAQWQFQIFAIEALSGFATVMGVSLANRRATRSFCHYILRKKNTFFLDPVAST